MLLFETIYISKNIANYLEDIDYFTIFAHKYRCYE